jgi:hypothetical protein
MTLKFWPFQPQLPAPPPPAAPTKFVLHGYTEAQMRHAFLTAPDSDQYKGVLEQCDLSLMEAVNDLVNHADGMTDGQMRQAVGKLRGITELRESFERREAQARKDLQATPEEKPAAGS